jgi:AcrR family transcriptional regulator
MKKGIISREEIIHESLGLMNKKGIRITLHDIAKELGVSKGKITYYFATKDSLFDAIRVKYEEEFNLLYQKLDLDQLDFCFLAKIYDELIELQFRYRTVFKYLFTFIPETSDLLGLSQAVIEKRFQNIQAMVKALVEKDLLKKEILEEKNWQVFLFLYVNTFGTWVFFKDFYYQHRSLHEVKDIIRVGIFYTYRPWLSKKGEEQLSTIL